MARQLVFTNNLDVTLKQMIEQLNLWVCHLVMPWMAIAKVVNVIRAFFFKQPDVKQLLLLNNTVSHAS